MAILAISKLRCLSRLAVDQWRKVLLLLLPFVVAFVFAFAVAVACSQRPRAKGRFIAICQSLLLSNVSTDGATIFNFTK